MPTLPLVGAGPSAPGGLSFYGSKVLAYSPAPIAYWLLDEAAGAAAACQVNAAQDGAYTAVTLGQAGIGDGHTAALFDGSTSWLDVYSTTFRDAFNGAEGSFMIWCKVSAAGVWADTIQRALCRFEYNGANYVRVEKGATANRLLYRFMAGGVNEIGIDTISDTTWICLLFTWSKAAEAVKLYINGTQQDTDVTLGVWTGALAAATTLIGAYTQVPAEVWSGYLAHVAVWDEALTKWAALDLYRFLITDPITNLAAADSGANGLHGIYVSTYLNHGGERCAYFDKTLPSYVVLPHATIQPLWNPDESMTFIRYKSEADNWTDAADSKQVTFRHEPSGPSYIIAEAGDARQRWYWSGQGALESVEKTTFSPTTWQTWAQYVSIANDEMRAYINGAQEGATQTGLTAWLAGLALQNAAIGSNCIDAGAGPVYGDQPWWGYLKDCIITLSGANVTGPDAKDAAIHASLAAGTLTAANLNTHFGAGKWAWWKLDETA